ncbi:putative membrane protein C6F6.13c [Erysiphe neolycopersici]|uniref:Putative membrane protein C6F6.13c n=1 Tax=Erysiphe neolycopersici TaxID=212602 RepID=A0A420HYB2_9PEZI|nr:putative membrane protein C6F6.13c [Erysiphe neolycopersici]
MALSADQGEAEPFLDDDNNDPITKISQEERIELLLLIEKILSFMRKQLSNVFVLPVADKKNNNTLLSGSSCCSNSEIQTNEEAEKIVADSRDPKLSVPSLDIEREALQFFDEWKDSVISQVKIAVKPPKNLKDFQGGKTVDENTSYISGENQAFETKVIRSTSYDIEADAALIELYPPISTSLCSLPQYKRRLLLKATLFILLSLKKYTSNSRILLAYVTSSLHIPLNLLVEEEMKIAQGLIKEVVNLSSSEEVEIRSRESKISHGWKVGLAGVAGAAVIGVTGGLATPLVAGAVGSIMGGLGLGATAISGLLGAIAQSSVVVGGLFGAYGARMTSKAIDSYAKEVNDFKFMSLRNSKDEDDVLENRRLRVTIGVSGWLTQEEDVISPWLVLGRENEVFALRWELEALKELGSSMESVVKSAAWKVAKKELIARTIFSSLLQALWPLSILKVSIIIDNPFSICMNRADKAGIILADAIINKAQGERPVTLIGYSLGARLIYSCLISLAERRAFGLIENVVLMGAPIPSTEAVWRTMRSIVSGRLVNVYSTNDYILAFLYRTWSVQYGVAGIQEVTGDTRVENVNVSGIVNGHLNYQHAVGNILEHIGWENVDKVEVSRERKILVKLEENDQNQGV